MIGRRFLSRPVSTIGTIIAPERTQTESVPLITESLVGYWDAWNPYSYPSSGTTWTNLSSSDTQNAILTNGPTFNIDGLGSISFDGTNDYVNTTSNFTEANNLFADANGAWTVSAWFKFPVTPISTRSANQGWIVVGRGGGFGTGSTFVLFVASNNNTNPFAPRVLVRGAQTDISSKAMNDNCWHNVTVVWTGSVLRMYLDGVYTGNATVGTATLQSHLVSFGSVNGASSNVGIFEGLIANTSIYNRAISDSEVYQNYQYALWRFMSPSPNTQIVTRGLVLHVDAGHSGSYSGNGTTWTDLSGSNNTGTLINGPTYSTDNSGTLLFDGTNDYATIGSTSFSFGATAGTLSAWAKVNTITTGTKWIVSYGNPAFKESRYLGTFDSNFYFGAFGDDLTAPNVPLNTWFNIVGVYNGTNAFLYINGSLVSGPTAKTWNTVANTAQIGRQTNGLEYFSGNISIVTVYNRALSAAEVTQNYNALRLRFGL